VSTRHPNGSAEDPVVREVLAALRGLRYGSVEIVVHDSEVVQIERREKVRLAGGAARNGGGRNGTGRDGGRHDGAGREDPGS